MTDTDYTAENEEAEDLAPPRSNQLARRGFADLSISVDNAATAALVAKSKADVESRWIMAMRRPREMNDVRQMMIKECKRPGFADVAIYHLPRGGNTISGLSIRFAEVAMRCMGNMLCEAMVLYDSDTERVVRVTATDLESNSTWPRDITIRKTVERKQLKRGQRALSERVNSFGDTVWIVEATDDEVAMKEAQLISKASRTAILRLIPGHLQDEMYGICEQIQKDKNAKDPNAEANKAFDAFGELGILPTQLEQWIGGPLTAITEPQLLRLKQLYRTIREGEITWPEALEAAEHARAQKNGGGRAVSSGQASPTPAATTPPRQRAAPKGTAAVKEQLVKAAAGPATVAPPREPAVQQDIGKTITEPAPDIKPPPPPVAPRISEQRNERAAPILEERPCIMCGVPVDAEKGSPNDQRCEACAAS